MCPDTLASSRWLRWGHPSVCLGARAPGTATARPPPWSRAGEPGLSSRPGSSPRPASSGASPPATPARSTSHGQLVCSAPLPL